MLKHLTDLPESFNPLVLYPSLSKVVPTLSTLPAICGPYQVAAGTVLFAANTECKGFPLLLDGEIKVQQESADGRCLELYRVTPGELCLVSSASLFRAQPLTASGIARCQSHFLLIPANIFACWLNQAEFRTDILGLFALRMTDLTILVDALAFQKLDQRLAAVLLDAGNDLLVTHQALADQLGTVREVITRILRRFEQQGCLELSREHIRIINTPLLQRLAAGDLSH